LSNKVAPLCCVSDMGLSPTLYQMTTGATPAKTRQQDEHSSEGPRYLVIVLE